jgi:hypothetical protein
VLRRTEHRNARTLQSSFPQSKEKTARLNIPPFSLSHAGGFGGLAP